MFSDFSIKQLEAGGINKQVRNWTEAGIMRVDDGYLVIPNPVELEKRTGAVLYLPAQGRCLIEQAAALTMPSAGGGDGCGGRYCGLGGSHRSDTPNDRPASSTALSSAVSR